MSSKRKSTAKNPAVAYPHVNGKKKDEEDYLTEEEFRKKFEPVAPWNRPNIPDYGPLGDWQNVFIFFAVGTAATLVFEFTDFFNEINRYVAYIAIWAPLWLRLLGRVSPAPTEEELEEREQQEFHRQLQKLADEEDEVDE